jgi:hypothetical protein
MGSVGGNVTIYYHAPIKGIGHELTRSTPLVDTPDFAALLSKDQSKHIVCNALDGTAVTPTGNTAKMSGVVMSREVVVTDTTAGECTGKRGWVSVQSLKKK